MRAKKKNNGSILIIVVFAIALMTALVAGILQLDTEQFQIMKNEIYAAQALAIAEAGLADAFAQLRSNPAWNAGFNNKSFGGGAYTVVVVGTTPDPNITSIGISPQGFVAELNAEVTISSSSPYIVRIDKLGINE